MSAEFHNISQISKFQQNITISAKYHNFSQISQYQPHFTISAKYDNFDQIVPRCSYMFLDFPRCSMWSSATSIFDGIFFRYNYFSCSTL